MKYQQNLKNSGVKMLNETELKMFAKVTFMLAGAIFILTGVCYPENSSMQISLGIACFCIGLAQD
jgi:1,4-dihydroxy-2-naphthoate octaprenyltransferase